MDRGAAIATKLLQIKAIKLSPQKPFIWSSGLLSPIYCDNRIALSHPDVRNFVVESLVRKATVFGPFSVVAGVATAGIPHGVLLADRLGLPFIYVRSKAKGHGRQNQIEGEFEEGARVLVIEDLISTGGSSLQAVMALRDAGAFPVGVLSIFSYGFEMAKTAFAEADCPFASLSNYEILLEQAVHEKYINEKELEVLKGWSWAPEKWKPAEQ